MRPQITRKNHPREVGFGLLAFLLIISGFSSISVEPAKAAAGTITSGNCSVVVGETTTASIAESGAHCYVAFKSGSNTFTVPANVTNIDYLVVAGGGSGGARHGGGGGAGGLISKIGISVSGITTLNVTVGVGGAAVRPSGGLNYAVGRPGNNSSIAKNGGSGSFTTDTAVGGGGGEGGGQGAQTGGSGGGRQSASFSTGTAGQGNNGGQGGQGSDIYWAGGGGGAGAVGGDGTNAAGGDGGAGSIWLSSFTTTIATALSLTQTRQTSGDQVYFAGGGGGSIAGGTTPAAGSGGLGGGGAANVNAGEDRVGIAGTENSGGGGGGTGCCEPIAFSGAGGSGIVIIKYTYATITSISPNTGSTAGGKSITITGTNLTGATGVTFGGTAGTSVSVVSSTSVTVTTPASAVGAVDVVVTLPSGSVTSAGAFTYITVGAEKLNQCVAAVNDPLYSNSEIARLMGYLNQTALETAITDGIVGVYIASGAGTFGGAASVDAPDLFCGDSNNNTVARLDSNVTTKDFFFGGAGDDLVTNSWFSVFYGGLGADRVETLSENSIFYGGPGVDSVGATDTGGTFYQQEPDALTPTFGTPTATATGFTVNITNYDAAFTWADPTVSSGTVVVTSTSSPNRLLTVSGLNPGASATITQTNSRDGYTSGSATFTAIAALVIDLDATNRSSYSGSGSNWTNLVNGTNYTISNGTYSSSDGGAIVFNRSNLTHVNLGTPLATGSNFTKEAWVKDTVGSGDRNIVSSPKSVLFISGTTLHGGIDPSYYLVSSSNFPLNEWVHVVLTFNDSTNTMSLYLNGALASTNASVSQSYTQEIERIGAHGNDSTAFSFWTGPISKVRIYNGALSSAQVTSRFDDSKSNYVAPADNQTITRTSTSPTSPVVGGTYTPTATSSSSLTVAISIAAGSSSICSISSGVVTFNAVGSCVIHYNQIGNSSYNAAAQVTETLSIGKGTPTFSWSGVSKTFGDSTFTVTAPTVIGSVPGSFAYSSATTSVISISGTTFTVAGAGTSVITATFTPTSTANYNSATTTMTVTVSSAAARTPTFGASTATASGFTVSITNYDAAFTWAGTATASGSVAISDTGLVTVTGVAAGTSSTATITTARTGYTGGSATVSGTAIASSGGSGGSGGGGGGGSNSSPPTGGPSDALNVIIEKVTGGQKVSWNNSSAVTIIVKSFNGTESKFENVSNSLEIPNPKPGESKQIVITRPGQPDQILWTKTIYQAPLSAQNLAVKQMTNKSLQVTWKPSSTVVGYRVVITPTVGAPVIVDTTDPKFAVQTAPGQKYTFEVIAIGAGGLESGTISKSASLSTGKVVTPLLEVAQTIQAKAFTQNAKTKLAVFAKTIAPDSSILCTGSASSSAGRASAFAAASRACATLQQANPEIFVKPVATIVSTMKNPKVRKSYVVGISVVIKPIG